MESSLVYVVRAKSSQYLSAKGLTEFFAEAVQHKTEDAAFKAAANQKDAVGVSEYQLQSGKPVPVRHMALPEAE